MSAPVVTPQEPHSRIVPIHIAAPMLFGEHSPAYSQELSQTQVFRGALGGQLTNLRARSNFHDPEQDYYPTKTTEELVTKKLIAEEFVRCKKKFEKLDDDDEQDNKAFYRRFQHYLEPVPQLELAHWIYDNAHKTLATAIVSDLTNLDLLTYMVMFKEWKFTDKDLSTSSVRQKTIGFAAPAQAQSFCDQRWKFLAPVFSPIQYDYDLASEHIFPFTKDLTKSCKGAFGVVSKVKVHKEHQGHSNMQYVSQSRLHVYSLIKYHRSQSKRSNS